MKKLLTSLLCVMMVVCFMPAMAWADGEEGAVETTLPEAQDGVVVLDKDYTVTTLDQNGTYDLNGHTLTVTEKPSTTIKPGEGETLVIYDSSTLDEEQRGTLIFESKGKTYYTDINPQAGGTVTVSNINIVSPNTVFYPQGDAAAVNVTNCSVTAGCYCVGTNAGNESNAGVVITLKDSTFVSNSDDKDNCTVMINVDGTLNIDNCDITGDRQAVLVRAGDATITNSTITVTGEWAAANANDANKYHTTDWGAGNEVPAAALIVGNHNKTAYNAPADVTVTNTTVSATTSPALYVDANQTYDSEIIISGSETKVTGNIIKTNNGEGNGTATIVVTGGTFSDSSAIESYVVEGMKVDGNGSVVINTEEAVAEVNGVGYTTLQAAIEAAQDGDTITLLDNITTGDNGKGNNEGVFTITKDLTIDGVKHKISAGDGFNVTTSTTGSKQSASMFNVEEGAKVTFENLIIDGNSLAKHGINVFSSDAEKISNVTVDNVTIENCNGYAIVNNGSDVTVNSITTSDNDWGGINVDSSDSSKQPASLTINDASISEENSVYFENASNSEITGNITGGTFKNVSIADKADTTEDIEKVTLTISGGTFVNDVSNYVADASRVYKKGDSYIVAASAPANSSGYNTWELVDGVYVEKYVSTGGYVPTTPTAQKPVIEPNADVTTSLSTDGTTLTIKANDGYEITDVTVNGVSKGAVTTLTGLKTGDKIVIKSQKIETPDDNAALIEAVKNTKLIARSAMSTAKGKKAVKVSWYAADGSDLDFDGYEVFRSLKRYSGFGTTPIFKTTNEKYYNTAIKKGNKYYYKVRAYKVIDGEKVYTDWSTKAWRTVK